MIAIIASYFLDANWFASAAQSMSVLDAMVKLGLTHGALAFFIGYCPLTLIIELMRMDTPHLTNDI